MAIQFTKMHGLGNDFMVIDGINQDIQFSATDIMNLSHRRTGVGFDQCLMIESIDSDTYPHSHADFFYRIYNADGSEVGQCGNGARCVARFIQRHQLTPKTSFSLQTKTAYMQVQVNPNQTVTVDMGQPKLSNLMPLDLTASTGEILQVHRVDVGNPHAILVVEDINQVLLEQLGPAIECHHSFPQKTNVGFLQILNNQTIRLRVHERGVGETQACGSGAVAAAAVVRRYYQGKANIQCILNGGNLDISWPNINDTLMMTGPATFVYEGKI